LGFVQEEDNLKLVLDDRGQPASGRPVLARELGVNRYEAVVDFDFAAGSIYWAQTASFWADVRLEWERIYSSTASFGLVTPSGEPPLFAPFFDYAAELEGGRAYDPSAGRDFIRETLAKYLH
jgi:hypothetical protein